jgi:hypothetical protein
MAYLAACHVRGYAKRIRVADEQVYPLGTTAHWRGVVPVSCRDTDRAVADKGSTSHAAAVSVAIRTQPLAVTND